MAFMRTHEQHNNRWIETIHSHWICGSIFLVFQRPSNRNASIARRLGEPAYGATGVERRTAENIEIKGNYSCRFVWNSDDLMLPTACKYRAMVERNCALCAQWRLFVRESTWQWQWQWQWRQRKNYVKIIGAKRYFLLLYCWSQFVCSS